MKRWRTPVAKPGQLKIAYGKEPGNYPELMFCWGQGASKRDTNMLMHFFGFATLPESRRTLVEELEARGYDISTLKFTIQKKPSVEEPQDSAKAG